MMVGIDYCLDARALCDLVDGTLEGNAGARILGGRADSRKCRTGDLYLALKGERTDGNLYVKAAWEAGAVAALADVKANLPKPPEGKALIRVSDPLTALQNAGRVLRESKTGLTVAGITGSNGKTTTKEILSAIIRRRDGESALVTEGNYNSDIGLPLTLMSLRSSHKTAVLEMGMNKKGEMALLASIAKPDVAVITNIGSAHVGMLGSREALAAEKRAIFDGADESSTAVIGADEPWADFLLKGYPGIVRRFGQWNTEGWESYTDLGLEGFELMRHGRKIRFALPGIHSMSNAMAAVEAALAMGVGEEDIAAGLESVRPVSGRSEVHFGAVTVIRDGYNANPESLKAALELFNGQSAEGRRVIVLGEMLELGNETHEALKAAGGAVADSAPDGLFLLGESLEVLKQAAIEAGFAGKAELFGSMDDLKRSIAEYLKPGDLVLLKGSRGSALERLDGIITEVGTV